MPGLEKDLKKEIRRTNINKAVISALAVSGIVAMALLAPNALSILGKMGLINPRQKKQAVKRSITRLIDRGYVTLEDGKARLTRKGQIFAAKLGEGNLAPRKPMRWDKKWRVLIFDIPEPRKKSREQIRATLMGMGFKRLQDSVWVYPYDCEDLVTLLKVDLKIGKDLLYIIADKIEHDSALRREFGIF